MTRGHRRIYTSLTDATGMARDADMVDVIHRGAADSSVFPPESHRFDKVHGRAEAGPEAKDRPDISGYFRFEQCNSHAA